MTPLDRLLNEKLAKRKEEGLFRELSTFKPAIDFCSNDYLGLARSKELKEIIDKKNSDHRIRNGATGSRLLSGNAEYAEAVEKYLTTIFKSESTLVFNSGYSANLAVLSAIPQRGDTIIYDELAHACIKDGTRLSLASRFSFKHNDIDDLEKKIKQAQGKVFIAIEAIYSMDGDEAPLVAIINLAKQYNASIILDEAHSTGSFGERGGGLAVSKKIDHHIDVRIHTFGKAMGIHGACVAGSNVLRDYLINFARPFIYTTALPPHAYMSIASAFEYLEQNLFLQHKLQYNIQLYLSSTERALDAALSNSAIQTVMIKGNREVRKVAIELQSLGFDVRPILSPTVPQGKERLRVCLHTFNTEKEIASLAGALKALSQTLATNHIV